MDINRRGFLKFIGAALAGSALPVDFAEAKIAKAPYWAKKVVRFNCYELAAGNYTFSCYIKMAGDNFYSLYVAGVKATGGETVFEIPYDGDHVNLANPQLSIEGVTYSYDDSNIGKVVKATELNRGKPYGNIKPWYRQNERY